MEIEILMCQFISLLSGGGGGGGGGILFCPNWPR